MKKYPRDLFSSRNLLPTCLAVLILLISMPSSAELTPTEAPLNPVYLNFQAQIQLSRLQSLEVASSGYVLGLIPPPIDYSYLKSFGSGINKSMSIAGSSSLPASYDLRVAPGYVTPVRNQGSCGSCWSFASISSIESNLLFQKSETWNFSENNLKNTHGFDWGHCAGGNADMATAYFARWSGPVNETDDPYNANSNVSPISLAGQKHLQEVLRFPPPSVSDLSSIKQAIMQYGGLYATYFENDSNYNPATHGYYYSGSSSANHAITIVGWNDNFPASSFTSTPPGNGAFLIKNSWGISWGESGYFYISYYDSNILDDIHAFNDSESTSNFSRIYQYDPLGKIGNTGYGSTSAWAGNVFTAAATEHIGAVAFYAASPGTSYTMRIYTNVATTPTTGTLALTQSGTVSLPGYHTIPLTLPVAVTSGQKFSIAMLLDTPGYNFPVPTEYSAAGYSTGATASPSQSYYTSNNSGNPGIWADATTGNSTRNVCIKAFATPDQYPLTVTFPGNGYGSINSIIPASPTINCTGGATCNPVSFPAGTGVTLTAVQDSSSSYNSVFTGWTTDTTACPGTGTCSVTMNGPIHVAVSFARDKLVKITPTGIAYGSILEANTAAASSGQTIQMRDNSDLIPFNESLLITKNLTMIGGFDSGFTINNGYTISNGSLTIKGDGVLKVQRIRLKY